MLMWLGFLACSGAIFISGYRLSINGDVIAEKSGLGRSWVGLVLIASVTSLPELVSGISAVAYTDSPDLATGGVLGSCAFNLSILVVMDSLLSGKPLSARLGGDNTMAGAIGIALIGTGAIGLLLAPGGWSIWRVGFYTPVIIVLYLIAMRLIFRFSAKQSGKGPAQEDLQYKHHSLRSSVIEFSMDSAIVIVAAIFLPVTCESIAAQTGLGETFVGNALVALSTSLPELVVSLAAVKIGAVEMSVGNVLGSNMFNMLVLAIDDIFYRKGPLLSHSQPHQIIPALASIAMTVIFIVGISFKAEKKRLPVGWDMLAIAAIFVIDLWLLLSLRS
jgi:cation:H+ antiporter